MSAGIQIGETFQPHSIFIDRVARAARGFNSLGIERGSSVAVMLRNDVPFLEATLAARHLGAYPVPLNWHLQPDEVRYILDNSDSEVLVIHEDLHKAAASGIPEDIRVFVVATTDELAKAYNLQVTNAPLPEGTTSWDEFVAAHEPWDQEAEQETASMVYTSGTTGRQKGVRREPSTPEQYEKNLETAFKVMGIQPGIRTIIPAPLYHSAPNFYAITSAVLESYIILMPRFDAEEFLRLVETYKITHVQMVPVMFIRLLKLPKEVREKYDVSSLENIVHAAAPCPADVKKAMIDWFGPIINEYYGSTELGILTYATSEDALKFPGTVGKPIDDCTMKIFNDDGEEVPQAETGTVYARVDWAAEFTYQHDDEKRRSIEMNDLLTCGDIGYFNEEGFLFLCDRANDMVISGGVNIYPAEIEAVLIQHDDVRDCAVFGIPDEEFGESLAAIIELQDGSTPSKEDMAAYLRDRLASFKVPRHIEFRDDLPREDSGKLFKRKLREPFWEKAGRKI